MNEKDKQEYLDYIFSRKSSNKRNFYKESLKEIECFKKEHPDRSPSIVLHEIGRAHV